MKNYILKESKKQQRVPKHGIREYYSYRSATAYFVYRQVETGKIIIWIWDTVRNTGGQLQNISSVIDSALTECTHKNLCKIYQDSKEAWNAYKRWQNFKTILVDDDGNPVDINKI